MEDIKNLAHLEAAVDKLLNAVTELKREKLELKAGLDIKDQEIEKLTRQLQTFQGERSQIEKRVNGLISAIDKWEKLNYSAGPVRKGETGTEEKTLF